MRLKGTRESTMPDRMKNTMTDAVPGKRLGTPPRTKWLDHDVDVIQEHHQRPEPSQAVKRQDALLVTRHRHPFLRAFEQSVPLYPRGFSVHFDEKDPRIGRIRGPGSSLCTLSGNVAAVGAGGHAAPYSASAASSRRATSSMRMASPCLAPATERPMSTPMPVM